MRFRRRLGFATAVLLSLGIALPWWLLRGKELVDLWPLAALVPLLVLLRPPRPKDWRLGQANDRMKSTIVEYEMGPKGRFCRAIQLSADVSSAWNIDLAGWSILQSWSDGAGGEPDNVQLLEAEPGLDRTLALADMIVTQIDGGGDDVSDRDDHGAVLIVDAGLWNVVDSTAKGRIPGFERLLELRLEEMSVHLRAPELRAILGTTLVLVEGIDQLRSSSEPLASRLLDAVNAFVVRSDDVQLVLVAGTSSADWIRSRSVVTFRLGQRLIRPNSSEVRSRLANVDHDGLDDTLADLEQCRVLSNPSWLAALLLLDDDGRDPVASNSDPAAALMSRLAARWLTVHTPIERAVDQNSLALLRDNQLSEAHGNRITLEDVMIDRRGGTVGLIGRLLMSVVAGFVATGIMILVLRFVVGPVFDSFTAGFTMEGFLSYRLQWFVIFAFVVLAAAATAIRDPISFRPPSTRFRRAAVPAGAALSGLFVWVFHGTLQGLSMAVVAVAVGLIGYLVAAGPAAPVSRASRISTAGLIPLVALGALAGTMLGVSLTVLAASAADVVRETGALPRSSYDIVSVFDGPMGPNIVTISVILVAPAATLVLVMTPPFAQLVTTISSGLAGLGWRPVRFLERAVDAGLLSHTDTGWTPTDATIFSRIELDSPPALVPRLTAVGFAFLVLTGIALASWPTLRTNTWRPLEDQVYAQPEPPATPSPPAAPVDSSRTPTTAPLTTASTTTAPAGPPGSSAVPADVERCLPLPAPQDPAAGDVEPQYVDVDQDGTHEVIIHVSTGANTRSFELYGRRADCEWVELGGFSVGGGVMYFSSICWDDAKPGVRQIYGDAIDVEEEPRWQVDIVDFELWPGPKLRQSSAEVVELDYDAVGNICDAVPDG